MSKPEAGLHPETKHAEVFISATSSDLRSVREIVKQGLLTMGCFPVEQTNFPPDYRSVHQMLEERIAKCDAVIHIVGQRYGAEPDPASLPEGTPRRSYTQLEAEIARQLGKKLYVFVCPEDFPYDQEPDIENEEKRGLQQAYRGQIAQGKNLRTAIRSREDIAIKVRELQFELEKLRKTVSLVRRRMFALLAVLLIVLGAIGAGVWWTALQAFHFDRNRVREELANEIRNEAQQTIAKLNPVEDWRQIKQLKDEEAQQLADIDRDLDRIQETSKSGEASAAYTTAVKLLQEKGVGEALGFLDSTSRERATEIEQQKNRVGREEEELDKLLQPELLKASLLEKQFRFTEAEAKYRKILEDAGTWPEPRNLFSDFLIRRGEVVDPAKGNAMLREGIDICQSTLALKPKNKAPQDWARTQNNLGLALWALGTRTGGEEGNRKLQAAVDAFNHALEVQTKADLSQGWATTQNNLGNALEDLGTRIGGEEGNQKLQAAVDAYHHALEVRTKADLPQDWASTQNHLGIALEDLGTRNGGEDGNQKLQAAVDAYHHALEVYTKADSPQDWAKTQNNLGNALEDLGTRTGGEEGNRKLQAAIDAYHRALEVFTKTDLPQDWAATQNNLGNALEDLGTRIGGEEGNQKLQAAVDAYHHALEVRTKADLPQDWAATQDNLGIALAALGTRTGGEEGDQKLQAAVDAHHHALEVRTKDDLPQDWAKTQNNLGVALEDLGTRTGGEEGNQKLQAAVDAYHHALEVRTKADLPQDWAETQNNLGNALAALGTRTGGEEGAQKLQAAVDAFDHALEVYTKTDFPQDWAATTKRRDAALADLARAKPAQGS
jgi:tetratricopeptide (TPR) repeat protein